MVSIVVLHEKRRFLTVLLLALAVVQSLWCMTPSEDECDGPVAIARCIRGGLESTRLPKPLVDLACTYYGDRYPISVIDLAREDLVPYTKDVFYLHAMHSIVRVWLTPSRSSDERCCLSILLTNGKCLHWPSLDGVLTAKDESELYSNSLVRHLDRHNQLTYGVLPSLINNETSSRYYTATIRDADRGKTIVKVVHNLQLISMYRWYADDNHHTHQQWLDGKDRRRTQVEIAYNLAGLLGIDEPKKAAHEECID